MGALVSQTSGTPINENLVSDDILNSYWTSENSYLPGVYSIGDMLEDEGYNQVFMIGSNGAFAGRSSYFKGHGNYEVMDYYSAIDEGWIDSNYYVWWGYEDAKLLNFAKQELLELAGKYEPFNFTILTSDTHFVGGYLCSECDNTESEQYSNVIRCSSTQVYNFVQWIKEQDFYDNTTVVISGDHLTMDSEYIGITGVDNFYRRMYFCIINPDEKCVDGNNRVFTSLDLYPTTLAAMGVDIEGNRLGLGVNLFSDEPSLAEDMGIEQLNIELVMNSKFYTDNLLYKQKQE